MFSISDDAVTVTEYGRKRAAVITGLSLPPVAITLMLAGSVLVSDPLTLILVVVVSALLLLVGLIVLLIGIIYPEKTYVFRPDEIEVLERRTRKLLKRHNASDLHRTLKEVIRNPEGTPEIVNYEFHFPIDVISITVVLDEVNPEHVSVFERFVEEHYPKWNAPSTRFRRH